MARLNSFYLPGEQWEDKGRAVFHIQGAEARHMLKVLRTKPGQHVRLFNGCGLEGLFMLDRADKNSAYLSPVEITETPEPVDRPTIALAWNKAGRRGSFLEKATELDAGKILFWQSERSQGRIPKEIKSSWIDKTAQASKQCGSVWLPELEIIQSGTSELARIATQYDRCYLLWESSEATEIITTSDMSSGRILMVVGPEGGLEDAEADMLMKSGFQPRTLGNRILRWETAALLCLGLSFWIRQSNTEST